MKIKRIISFILLFGIIATVMGTTDVFADNKESFKIELTINDPVMKINGIDTEIDSGSNTVPVILQGRTLVPIRAIIEAMGGTVAWEQETKTVTLDYGEDEIKLIIDSTTAYLNDEIKMLDCAPTIINERTMLPIRFIAEGFGFEVKWVQESQTVVIAKNDDIYEVKNPLAERKSDGGLTRIFNSITCIGDSLTAGVLEFQKEQEDGTYKNVATTVMTKSYPTRMKEILGIDVYNLGIGGHIAANDSEKQLAESKTVYSLLYKTQELKMWDKLVSGGVPMHV